MAAATVDFTAPDRADGQCIVGWRERLWRGEPWAPIEVEILAHTGGCPEALLSLLVTALDVCGAPGTASA